MVHFLCTFVCQMWSISCDSRCSVIDNFFSQVFIGHISDIVRLFVCLSWCLRCVVCYRLNGEMKMQAVGCIDLVAAVGCSPAPVNPNIGGPPFVSPVEIQDDIGEADLRTLSYPTRVFSFVGHEARLSTHWCWVEFQKNDIDPALQRKNEVRIETIRLARGFKTTKRIQSWNRLVMRLPANSFHNWMRTKRVKRWSHYSKMRWSATTILSTGFHRIPKWTFISTLHVEFCRQMHSFG